MFVCMGRDGANVLVGGAANLVVCQRVLTCTHVNVMGEEGRAEKKD